MIAAIELREILTSEVAAATPFRLITLAIFVLAVLHTLFANVFTHLSEKVAKAHAKNGAQDVSFFAEVLHFLGEIELVFALWVVPLIFTITAFYGWDDVLYYLDSRVYVEPFFIVVVMSLASTRPIIQLAERSLHSLARLFGDTKAVWWLCIMTIGPVLGCLITEVAALTISALLLKEKLFIYNPPKRLAYGTLGLMFVNFSVGGVLTNFAAPPALTLSRCWNWSALDFFHQFGWRVLIGIAVVNFLYYIFFRSDFKKLKRVHYKEEKAVGSDKRKGKVPVWITLIHAAFLIWTIMMAHYPPVFMGSYLLFLGFHQATRGYQYQLNLRRPLMVGLFLAGLIIHVGFQEWWIEPLIGDLGFGALMLSGTLLTAFNENTTVAALACLIDDLAPLMRYALVAGIVAGGGLTIIAHAPNPVGQALLRRYFGGEISQRKLFLSALGPTIIFLLIFYLFPTKI